MIYLTVLENPAAHKAKGGCFCHIHKQSGTGMESGCSSKTQPETGGSTWVSLGVPETTPWSSIISDWWKKIDGKPFSPLHTLQISHSHSCSCSLHEQTITYERRKFITIKESILKYATVMSNILKNGNKILQWDPLSNMHKDDSVYHTCTLPLAQSSFSLP